MTDSVERFTSRVDNYVKYRPDYPREILTFLTANGILRKTDVVADIGCGTGISTRMFLENGNPVFGVEPNEAMRSASMEYLRDFAGFTPVDGTSDATGLELASVDLAVAAQAFHWFDPKATRAELKRILKSGGGVVLMWNERQLDTTPFLVDYERFIMHWGRDYSVVRHDNIKDGELENFFAQPYEQQTFENIQRLDFEGLKGRLLSSSYMPDERHASYKDMIESLTSLFAKHQQNGRIEILYDTNVFYSRPFLWQ